MTNSNIRDTRTNNAVCGVVRCLVDTLDVEAFMKNCEADFRAWLANLQYVLDGDVAAHLQNEIDRLRQDLDDGKYSTPSIVNITTVPGATITMTKVQKSVEAKADSKGAAKIQPDELGTWAVTIKTAIILCCGSSSTHPAPRGSVNNWWTRSPNTGNATNFIYVNTSGANNNNNNASNSYGVCLGLYEQAAETSPPRICQTK